MFAVIKAGGKQYRVAPNDLLRIERIEGQPGDTVELGSVLMVGGKDGVTLGAPLVEGAAIAAEVVEQSRADKIIVFKRKRRKNHRRRNGHRQHQTVLRVTEILTGGKKPGKAKTAKPKPAPEESEKAPPAPEQAEVAPKAAEAEKAPAKQAPAKKAATKKAVTKKAATKKAPAKKTAAKKAAKKSAQQEE